MISAPPPLNGMCTRFEAGALGQDFGVDLLIAADAGAAVADLARMRLGVGEEFGEGLGERRNVGRGREKEDRNVGERGDDLHVPLVVDLHLLREQDRRQSVGGNVADHQRVAVGPGARHLLDRDDAGGAGLVLDEDALPEALPQLLGIEARDHVGQAAGRIGHDDPDRLRWIGALCRCRRHDGREKCRKTAREQKPPPQMPH